MKQEVKVCELWKKNECCVIHEKFAQLKLENVKLRFRFRR